MTNRPIWELATWRDAAPSGQPQTQLTSGEDWFYSVTQSRINGVQDGYTAAGYSSYPDLQATACRTDCDDVNGCIRGTVARITTGGSVEWYHDSGLEGDYFRVIDTADGGFLAVGRTADRSQVSYNPATDHPSSGLSLMCNLPGQTTIGRRLMLVSKYTHDGVLEWQRTYGAMTNPNDHLPGSAPALVQDSQDIAWDAVERPGGGFRVVGCAVTSADPKTPRAFVIDITAGGAVIDKRVYGVPNARSMFLSITRNGSNYVMSGTQFRGPASTSPKGDVYVMSLGETLGVPVRNVVFASNTPDSHNVGYDVAFGTTGTLMLASIEGCEKFPGVFFSGCFQNGAGGTGRAVVERLDPTYLTPIANGRVELGEVRAYDLYVRLTPLSNGGFGVVSTYQPGGPLPGAPLWFNTDALVYRLNPDGSPAQSNPDGSPVPLPLYAAQTNMPHVAEDGQPAQDKKQECLYDIAEAEDGGLVIAGNNSSNLDDSYVVRFGSTAPATFPLVDLYHSHLIYPGVAGQPLTTNFSNVVSVAEDSRFDVGPARTLRFAPGKRLIVHGVVTSTGATLAAAGAGGWGGVYVGPTFNFFGQSAPAREYLPGSVFSNTVIQDVVGYYLYDDTTLPVSALDVRDYTVLVTNEARIDGSGGSTTNGIHAQGPFARVTVEGVSQIRNHDGLGLYATSGAQVQVRGASVLQENTAGGVYLNGYGTRVDLDGVAQVNQNRGPGVVAYNQSYVRIRSAGANANTSVSDNVGGPTALTSGSVDAGQCTPAGPSGPNHFVNNHQSRASYDARARNGSSIGARRVWWGPGRTIPTATTGDPLILQPDKSSTITFSLASSVSQLDTSCPSASERTALGGASFDAVATGDAEPVAQRGGPVTAAVVALATEAREAAWAGAPDAAFALLVQAAGASLTDDDREAVYGAIGALVAEADTALTVPDVVAALVATPEGASRAWSQRALAVSYAVTKRAAQADAVAESLTTAQAGTDHATFGHMVRVRLAVEADSLDMATERLGAFAATVTATDTLATEMYASSLSLVAASFPGADLGGVAGRTAGRGAASATASEGSGASSVYADEVAVYPNPSSGRGTVRVSVSEATSNALVRVYDALGRRVAILHDGPLAAGPHEIAFDASSFAPGVYVVHARVTPESGAVWTHVQRVTVAR